MEFALTFVIFKPTDFLAKYYRLVLLLLLKSSVQSSVFKLSSSMDNWILLIDLWLVILIQEVLVWDDISFSIFSYTHLNSISNLKEKITLSSYCFICFFGADTRYRPPITQTYGHRRKKKTTHLWPYALSLQVIGPT